MSTAALQPDDHHETAPGPIVVMGVSGSGKSSVAQALAERLGLRFLEGDRLHPAENIRKMGLGIPLDDNDRWPWLDTLAAQLGCEDDIVLSCSALKRSYRDRLRRGAGRPITFVFLDGSRALLSARMAGRSGHFMPASLLDSQLATLEPPTGEDDAITVDIDQPLDAIVAATLSALRARAVQAGILQAGALRNGSAG